MHNPKRTNRIILLALLVLFAAPVLLATLMHSQWWSYRPDSTRNSGELLQPPVAVSGWPDTSSHLSITDQTPIWTLLLASTQDCGELCQQQLAWLRQVRSAQGRHADQVELQLLTDQPLSTAQQASVTALSEAIKLSDPARRIALWQAIAQLTPVSTQSTLTTYLIDPAGFIILRYPDNADAGGIRKDLGRLLTWSNKARGPE